MARLIVKTLIFSFLLVNTACAEEPKAPVEPSGPAGGGPEKAGNELDLMALSYQGKDPFDNDCSLYLSVVEEEHQGVHHHEIVAKLGYTVHGQAPLDSIVEFQRYANNKYYPVGSTQPNAIPVLASAILEDETMPVDLNKLGEYEQHGELVQALRLDFADFDVEDFESALEEVVEDNSKFSANKANLDQLQRAVLKLAHGGHYDAAVCSNFELVEAKQVKFEVGEDHDDHDDDDHDHDHDH